MISLLNMLKILISTNTTKNRSSNVDKFHRQITRFYIITAILEDYIDQSVIIYIK